MKKLFILTFILFSFQIVQAEKYALIIAIGDYDYKTTGWSKISSANDVPLIKQTLINQKFDEKNIQLLIDEQATFSGIQTALANLLNRIKPGDIVVIHYSGHGQQIFDDNSEEVDGLDEALVSYDARVSYSDEYKGENHVRDDQIGNILANFRNKLGSNGQLLVLLDSCHSGSSTRGGKTRGGEAAFVPDNWKAPSGDLTKGSDMFEKVGISNDAAPFVLISGASADELNYEYDGKGSLSYSFTKAMSELGEDFTYRQLYSKIASIMNTISPNQTPTIEGSQDSKLFKNEYVKQQKYYEVVDVPKADVVKMRAGRLHGVFEGTTVWIMPSGTQKFSEDKVISTGEVLLAKFNESNIQLDNPLEGTNDKDYWVFINEKTYADINLQVFLDKNIDRNTKKELNGFLEKNKLGSVVKDSLDSDVFITETNGNYELNTTNGFLEFAEEDKNRGSSAMESLEKKLFNFAQGQYLKSLNMDNEKYEFSFRLLPIEYDVVMETYGDTQSPEKYTNESGMFVVRPGKDQVVLEVTNQGTEPIYFSLIEINSKGEINPFLPNDNCNLNDNERQIQPGKTMVFKDCIFSFGPPYEKLMIKGFASPNPINFQSTVTSRGKKKRSGKPNPLEEFIGQTYTQSRGQSSASVSGKIDGYSTEMMYEIVKSQK